MSSHWKNITEVHDRESEINSQCFCLFVQSGKRRAKGKDSDTDRDRQTNRQSRSQWYNSMLGNSWDNYLWLSLELTSQDQSFIAFSFCVIQQRISAFCNSPNKRKMDGSSWSEGRKQWVKKKGGGRDDKVQ